MQKEIPSEDHFGEHETAYSSLPGWREDDHAEALSVFQTSCVKLALRPQAASSGSGLQVSEEVWRSLCNDAALAKGSPERARRFFEERFVPFTVTNNGRKEGLFTGYYEPLLYGSRKKTGDFIYPVYGPPPEMKDKMPYFTRKQIDEGALKNRKLEIFWVDDPVMLFFMHIQGSGRIKLTDGKTVRVGFAGKTGHPYGSLGKVMGEKKLLPRDKIDFFTIRQWLYTHKDKAKGVMQNNPSYIFFKELKGDGPIGAVGVPLTPLRSLAVDKRYVPYGLPLFLTTELPGRPGAKPTPLRRIMIAQDTGTAITGPVRGDIFFGSGSDAEYFAGNMKGRGVYMLLVPKEIAYQMR